MKIVINKCYGGFGLSHEAMLLYGKLKGLNLVWEVDESKLCYYYIGEISDDTHFADWEIERNDPFLIQVVEELGKNANGRSAELKIVNVPDDIKGWSIEDYDGIESIHECHRVFK